MVMLDGKRIGEGEPCYIIAEIGSNYNGSLETAEEMIKLASDAGVDAVKFQIFKEKGLYPVNAGTVDYLQLNKTINDLVKENEVPDDYHRQLLQLCEKYNVTYLCTPTDENVADYLDDIGVRGFKIASYALTHHPLLRHIARKNKPIILSTGCTFLEEVATAVRIIKEEGNDQLLLMQCVSQYPADIEATNLKVINTLKSAFEIPVGMSDHSEDPYVVPYASVAIGANMLEKHYTLDRRQDGPDHSFAVEADELAQMVRGIRSVEAAMGTGKKFVTVAETEMRDFAHRSIFACKTIAKGAAISRENTAILRPGKKKPGIIPASYELVLGSSVNKEISNGTAIQWEDLLSK